MTNALQKRISDLCKRSLKEKWNKDESGEIGDRCPFCYDAWSRYNRLSVDAKENIYWLSKFCSICDCPLSICGDHARKGFICELTNKYKKYNQEIKISDLSPEDLNHMQELFREQIIKD
jgi:hypothetical protein